MAGTVGALTAAPAEAVAGTASGRVFRDYNMNGAFDPTSTTATPSAEVGLAGVTVRAYDRDNNVVQTATTAANGTYTLSYNTGTTTANVRLEFDVPTGMVPSRSGVAGATSDTTVQFVGTGVTDANLGLVYPQDYAPVNPTIAFARQVATVRIDGTANSTAVGTLFSQPYTTTGPTATTPATVEATAAQTGSIWGVATLSDSRIFSAAFLRRHAAIGNSGLGAVYVTTPGGATDASLFATVANAGTNPRGTSTVSNQGSYNYFNDVAAFDDIGKIGLGGMVMAPDDSALYVVNLATKSLVRIPVNVNASTGAVTAGTQTTYTIPVPTNCTEANTRPFGVGTGYDSLWVTQTCTGPAASNLRSYVYKFDPVANTFTTTPAFQTALSGYNRGGIIGTTSAAWLPWADNTAAFNDGVDDDPMPLTSDVVFDSDGDLTIGIKDRFADQTGKAGIPVAGSGTFEDGYSAGDVLRACGTPASGWTLESNGSCGGATGWGVGNNQGPGGGEFYNDDYDSSGVNHDQISLSGMLQIPGRPQLIDTMFDPNSGGQLETFGWRYLNNSNGASAGYRQIGTHAREGDESQYGKAGGMGDLDALIEVPVEIGNRVWIDTDRDGLQDPGEAAVAGVQVSLLNAGGTVVGTTTTAADGSYYFNDGNVTGGLTAGAAYRVRLQRSSDFASGGALFGYQPTTQNAGSKDTIDSDAAIVSSFPEISVTAPRFGGNHNFDFGFVRPSVSVGDFVWNDLDRDGVQDAGEPGIPGVQVTITAPGGGSVTDVFGNTVGPDTTDANGAYGFANLPALPTGQSYTVSVNNNQTALTAAGYVPTVTGAGNAATDSSNGSATSGNLTANGASDNTLDFGFVKKAVSVGDFVWVDSDRDGVQDAGEPGIPGVTVTITKADGTAVTNVNGQPVTSDVTDANGKYSFDLLPAGVAYRVSINNGQAALAGYLPTVTGAGTAATDSSNGSATSAVLANNGDSDVTLDFGFVKPAVSVGDFVWVDTDRDGVQDAGEPGIQGVTVTITRTDGATVRTTTGATVTSTSTNAAGAYGFTNLEALPSGVFYRVAVDNSQAALAGAGYVPTTTGAGTPATDSSNGTATSGALTTNGASDTTLDFGFVKRAVSVGDFVWVDLDKDGVQDAGEPGIPGVTVTITTAAGGPVTNVNGVAVTSVVTDANGRYTFGLLPAGVAYRVSVDNAQPALADYLPTVTGAGTPATDSSNGSATSGVLAGNGDSDVTLDFGFRRKSVSVGDFVWVDTDRDGIQDAGEPGIQGVTVTIARTDGQPVRKDDGSTVTSTTTNAAGSYSFSDLQALPAGVFYRVAVDNGQVALNGYVPTLTGQGTPATDSSNGNATSGALTNDGATDFTLDFGFVRPAVTVGDFVWFDADGDGVQDAGETGIAGVTVTITKADGTAVTNVNGQPVTSTVTGANGQYTFPLLPAGVAYRVSVDNTQAALFPYVPTQTGQGTPATDSSTGSATTAVLNGNGTTDLTLDFGFVKKKVSVGDFVWVDTDRDGIQDAGEPGIQGVTVTITRTDGATVRNISGAAVTSTTTDAFGKYLFANLEPLAAGTHYVTAVNNGQAALAAYVPTLAGVGADRAVDSSTGSAESGNLTTDGAADLTLDFGFVRPAVTVGDFVWFDADGDGIQDAGETGIPGVTVTIRTGGGQVVTDVNGNTVGPVVTDANGQYTFPLLPAGVAYTVSVDNTQAALFAYAPTLTGQGTPATDSSTGSATTAVLNGNGASDLTLDFGFVKKKVSVGDFVWVDTDRDGIQDAGEPGIQGVTVTIERTDGAPVRTIAGATVTSTTTNANGLYLFSNLEPLAAGTHYVTRVNNGQAALAGYVPTLAGVGADRAVDSSTGSAESRDLTTDGAADLTLDFGFVRPAVTVGDFVWFDQNGNGIQDAGETGIPGVTVTIRTPGGAPVTDVNGNTVGPVVTDANGRYTFVNLPSGAAYTVTVDNGQAALNNYAPTQTGQGTPATDSSNGTYTTPVLTGNGASDLTADFGFVSAAPMVRLDKTASAINDLDGNGPDAGDQITYSFVVTNTGNRVLDPVVVTDPLFAGGTGNVTCGSGPLAVGASRTCTPRTYTLTQADVNAGAVNNTATVRGTAPNGTVVTDDDSTTTPAVPQSVSVGDFVWVDTDRDGVQDAGEPGIQGVRLTIVGPTGNPVTDVNGNPVGAATTNASGKYLFAGLPILPAGQSYTVRVDNTQAALAAYVPTLAGVGGDRAVDSSTGSAVSGNLTTNGASDLTLDFGYVRPAVTVGDFVWVDQNGNGIQDAGEPGIPGVTVRITKADGTPVTDVNGNPVTTTVTGANGGYTFPLLPAGVAYTVTVDNGQPALAAYVPTQTGQGTPATDSSNGTYTTPVLTGNGATDLTADFGFRPAAPAVRLDKTASAINDLDGNGPDAGDQITYSFVVTNTGNVVLNPVAVNDPLFGGAAPNVTCGTGPLAVGASRTCTPRTYTLTQADVNAGSRANTATVQGTAPNGTVVSDDDSTTTPVAPLKVSVGDFVWVDTDRDGLLDAGEPGIQGVTVTITRTDGQPVRNAAGATVTSTTTNANGLYLFADLQVLPAGTHYVTAVAGNQAALAAYVPTLAGVGADRAVDSSTGSAESRDLTTNGASDLTLDFGFVRPAVTVGDFVWVDQNGNGIQDAGEPGIPGVVVRITTSTGQPVTDVNGNPVGPRTTDGNGGYTFPLLPAGVAYTVTVDNGQAALAGYVPTQTGQGTPATDSSNGTYTTPVLTGNGATDLTADFGFRPAAPMVRLDKSASAINDLDGNGPDAGDQITYSFVVTNTGNVVLDPVVVTDPLFGAGTGNVTCGSGPLAVGASRTCTPTTYTLTQADVNTGAVNNTATVRGTAPNGTVVTDDDTTSTPVAPAKVSVGDFVWVDTDRDGLQDAGEPGIQGVTVTITRTDGQPVRNAAGATVTSTTTNANGLYLFADLQVLPAGTHYVTAVAGNQAALAAYVPTLAGVGADRAVDSSTGSAESRDLTTNGASDLTLDFGFVRPAVTVGDFVWVDQNGNGIQDAGEPGIPGVVVRITTSTGQPVTDVNGNPVGPLTTGANGQYLFTNLPAGVAYTVTVDNGQAGLNGYVPTRAEQGGDRTVDSSNGSYTTPVLTGNGASDRTADFGFVQAAPRVEIDKSASAINDLDGNGPDAGDQITYSFVVTNTGNVVLNPVVVTDPLFAGGTGNVTCGSGPLAVGASRTCTPRTYTLTQADVNAGAVNNTATVRGTAPNGTVVTDDDSTTTPAVPQSVSVGDFVWVDTDRDGVQDAGEPGIQGVRLTIVGPTGNPVTDVNGNPVGAATTNAAGLYLFGNLPVLPAGQSYTVRVDNTQAALAAYVPTLAGVGGDRAVDSSTGSAVSGNLTTNGASDLTLDFGYVRPAVTVGDTVFADADRDGTQDPGEPGLPGIVVTIVGPNGQPVTDVFGNPVGPETTDGNGTYLFTDLPALPAGQSYTVVVNPNQPALAGYTPTNDPGPTGPLTTNGASDLTVDFGFARNRVSVGDFVWVDTDRDGVQDAGEPGIPGVRVTITKANGDPVVDVLGNPVGPQTTDANGGYLFTNLPDGVAYTVRVDNTQPALDGYVPTRTGQGTPATDSSNGSATSAVLNGNGASDRTLDFGFVRPAVSVGDYVFVDANGNGIQDAGDTGLPGVVLTIVGPGGQPVTDVYGNPVGPVTSGGNGQYVFTNLPALPAGQGYTVRVDNAQPALAAYTPAPTGQGTPATDSSNGSGQTGNLTADGATDTTVDFGFVPNRPAIQLDKTASSVNDLDGNGPDAGDTITYGFRVTNTGNATLTNVTVTDPMFPAGITCPTAPLAPGASVTCSPRTYTLSVDDVNNGRVENTATVRGTSPTGTVVTDTDSTSTPVVPVTGRANVKITKTVDDETPSVGDTVTYTLRVENTGDADADDVVVSDTIPAGVTFVSADAPCTQAGGVVTCELGTLEPGQVRTVTITATVDNVPAGTTQERHQIDVQKQEVVLDVEAGQTASTTVGCQPGFTVLDGSAKVFSSGSNVAVLENRATDNSTWKATLQNLGADRSQNKVFVVCARNETETVNNHSHQLQVSPAPVTRTVALGAGRTNVTLDCASGTTPVQPGWLLDGNARVVTSYPLGGSSWVFGVDNAATGGATTGTFSIRCLDNQTSTVAGHSHDLDLAGLFRTVTVPAGQTVDVNLDCVNAANGVNGPKGIVGGYNLASGLTSGSPSTGVVHQGNEPQPVRRVFTLTNPTSGDLTADLFLLCLGTRTAGHDGSGDIVNTATVSTTSPERSTDDNVSSATIRVTRATTPDVPKANLVVDKTVSDASPRIGDTVTYTLKVTNTGVAAAEDVVLTDLVPAGVTLVDVASPGTVEPDGSVRFALGTIAAGASRTVTLQARVSSLPPATGPAHSHDIDVQKVEQGVVLAAGETRTVSVGCAPGYLATDGSGLVKSIDQGTGTPDAVRITGSRATDAGTWAVTLANTATGQAQAAAYVVCTKAETQQADGHTHPLVVSAPVTQTAALTDGLNTATLTCATGRPVAPGYALTGNAVVRETFPTGNDKWTFVIDAVGAGSADLSISCLDEKTGTADGHQHDLTLSPVFQTSTVKPGETLVVRSECGSAKGITAGFRMGLGLVQIGNEPQPVNRDFRFYNPTGRPIDVETYLLCLHTKTSSNPGSGQVVNTAYAVTSTPESATGDNTDSVGFKVDTSSIAAPVAPRATVAPRAAYVSTTVACTGGTTSCKGTVLLLANKTQVLNGKVVKKGTVLAKRTFTVAKGKRVVVKMTPTVAGKRALTAKALKTAQVKIGSKVRTVRLAR